MKEIDFSTLATQWSIKNGVDIGISLAPKKFSSVRIS